MIGATRTDKRAEVTRGFRDPVAILAPRCVTPPSSDSAASATNSGSAANGPRSGASVDILHLDLFARHLLRQRRCHMKGSSAPSSTSEGAVEVTSTQILHQLIGLEDIGTDLVAPADFGLGLIFARAASRFWSSASYIRAFSIAVARFLCCDRSFWLATTMPVRMCVIRTARSVVLTCCPPAPEAR